MLLCKPLETSTKAGVFKGIAPSYNETASKPVNGKTLWVSVLAELLQYLKLVVNLLPKPSREVRMQSTIHRKALASRILPVEIVDKLISNRILRQNKWLQVDVVCQTMQDGFGLRVFSGFSKVTYVSSPL